MGTLWTPAETAETDDLGEYRLHGLRAYRYLLYVQGPPEPSPRGVIYNAFTPSYYPNAPSIEQATPVHVDWGVELTGFDFHLNGSSDTTVRGLVLDTASGEPCGECQIMVLGGAAVRVPEQTFPTHDGVFVIEGLAPGPYRLATRIRASRRARTAGVDIQVPSSGEITVRIEVGVGQTVSGELVLEDPPEKEQRADPLENTEPRQQRRRAQVSLAGKTFETWSGPARQGNVNSETNLFEVPGVSPGSYRVFVHGTGGYLRAVSLGGQEFQRPEIPVTGDGPVSGLRLHVAFDGATISGTVRADSHEDDTEPSLQPAVILLPDRASNFYGMRQIRPVLPDGSFLFENVAPGAYTLVCAQDPTTASIDEPAIRRALEPYAKAVTVSKNEHASVALALVPPSALLW
jgi:hypothetical protein